MNMICLLKELSEIRKQHYCMLLKDKKCITVRWRVSVKSLLYQANSDLKLKQSWRCSIESVIFSKNISWYHTVSYVWVHLVLSGEKYHPNTHLPVNLPPWILAINYKLYNNNNKMLEKGHPYSVRAQAGGEESWKALLESLSLSVCKRWFCTERRLLKWYVLYLKGKRQ